MDSAWPFGHGLLLNTLYLYSLYVGLWEFIYQLMWQAIALIIIRSSFVS